MAKMIRIWAYIKQPVVRSVGDVVIKIVDVPSTIHKKGDHHILEYVVNRQNFSSEKFYEEGGQFQYELVNEELNSVVLPPHGDSYSSYALVMTIMNWRNTRMGALVHEFEFTTNIGDKWKGCLCTEDLNWLETGQHGIDEFGWMEERVWDVYMDGLKEARESKLKIDRKDYGPTGSIAATLALRIKKFHDGIYYRFDEKTFYDPYVGVDSIGIHTTVNPIPRKLGEEARTNDDLVRNRIMFQEELENLRRRVARDSSQPVQITKTYWFCDMNGHLIMM